MQPAMRAGSTMQEIKFRLVNPGLNPRRTKLEVPGWAGKPEPRKDGSHEYAWHCMPFTEGAQYGIEIFYPFENELHVSKRNGEFVFDGDFGPPPYDDLQWPPFRRFGDEYYTYQLLLDLKVGLGVGGAHRAASALLHRYDRHRSDCRSGLVAHGMVADDFIRRVQVARGRARHTSSAPANRCYRY